MLNIFLQVPRLLKVIQREHQVVEELVARYKFDFVISDNRFGCWTNNAKTVFITHQVHILMPPALKLAEPIINLFNRRFINRFDACWIPDEPGSPYSGKLSETKMRSAKYVGLLSRFTPGGVEEKKIYCLAIISGPEPQRTLFENLVTPGFEKLGCPCAIVRGVPGTARSWTKHAEVSITDHLPASEMQSLIGQSAWIVARSGYSTIMDMARMGAKAIFVPTPGQTEQEYLAARLENEGVAFCQSQQTFNLSVALPSAEEYSGFAVNDQQPNLLIDAIEELIS